MIAGGVRAGANRPNQASTGISGTPASPIVGTSGRLGQRRAEVMAMPVTLSARIACSVRFTVKVAMSTSPVITACSASGVLL